MSDVTVPATVATLGLAVLGPAPSRYVLIALPVCLAQLHELIREASDAVSTLDNPYPERLLHAFVLETAEVGDLSMNDPDFRRTTAPIRQYGYGVLTETEPAFLQDREPCRVRVSPWAFSVELLLDEPVRSRIERFSTARISVSTSVLLTALWNLGGRDHQKDALALSPHDSFSTKLITGEFDRMFAHRDVPLALEASDLQPLLESSSHETRLAAIQALGLAEHRRSRQ